MEKTLEGLISKTKSHLKKATLGAIILTSLSGNSAERTQDTQEATYNYFSQEANQSSNFSQSKQGLYEKFELEGISSTGNYQTESPQPQNSMTIKNSIEQSPGKISFSYDLTQNTQTNGQKLFEESSSRTNVYFAVPRGALEGIYQEVSVFDYSKKEKKTLFATDGANQRLEEQLGKFNRTIAKLKGKSSQNLNKERNEYEAALDHAIDLAPGKIGLGLKAGKNLLKKLGQKNEERRIQNLQEKLGEDYEIIRMPSNSTNGSLSELFFTHEITGRKTTLLYSPGKIKEGQRIHISVPNLTFTKMQNGLERTTEIGGLEYEITLDKEKNVGEEIYGDWVLAPENWGIDNKKYLQYSFKENAKGDIDVQIILNDSKDKTYFSKNCQSTIRNLNPEFFVRTGNYPGGYKYNDFRSLEEGEIKDAEKFYKDWWDKKILLNSWTPEGTKSVEDIKSLHIKLIGKNRLIYSKNFDEKKGMIEERGLYFMVRKNSKMESSNFEDLQGMWVRKFRKKGLSGTNIVISKNRISEYYPAWGGNQELIKKSGKFEESNYLGSMTFIKYKNKLLFSNSEQGKFEGVLEKDLNENLNYAISRSLKTSTGYQINNLKEVIAFYYRENNRNLPNDLNELKQDHKISGKPYLTDFRLIRDPWGGQYIFEKKNNSEYSIKTLGADGIIGGTGENKDIIVKEKLD